ncbi:hypothetical protein CL616_00380 [archaeon]|nr:hypothetical protein [archaeon]|tara:strand:- start:129 stop:1139 length:1011 start_codon:yes stop_codon:yes gene_type:complete
MKKNIKLSKKKYFKLGKIPLGIGAIMDGWDFSEEEFRNSRCLNIEFRAFKNACPLNCPYCFTDKIKSDLTLDEIRDVILQLKELGTKTINFVGEGEPTIDKNFLDVMSFCYKNNIKPIVFSEGTTKLGNIDFIKKLKQYDVTIVLKCDSLFNEEYQNKIVGSKNYFKKRNKILNFLMKNNFNKSNEKGTTHLALNMIVTRSNKSEVLKTVEFCRKNNIFVMLVEYLPTGRVEKKDFDKSSILFRDDIKKIRNQINDLDSKKYGFIHDSFTSYSFVPCTIYGGVHIYGNGDVARCAGNAKVLGNIRNESLKKIWNKIKLDKNKFHGNCPYRNEAWGK